MAEVPLSYRAYVALTMALVPFAAWFVTRKLRRAGVSIDRSHEVLGHSTEIRTGSPLVWFHGASVGESVATLSLITRMGEALPRAQFLITSGTATSARVVAGRLPPRTVHQFAPLDAPGPLKRFLRHWRPDAAIFVESELWPQMLRRTRARGAKMALVNARLSPRSQAGWRKRPAVARYLFGVFDLILSQNDAMAEAMVAMHAPADRVARGINLKSLSAPLPVDSDAATQTKAALSGRPLWIASSTHPGEEDILLEAHQHLLKTWPDLCLLLAPRHPERGAELARMIAARGLGVTRRSAGEGPDAQVWLTDTIGELGTWYSLSPIVFLGGSLHPIGGHNPFEVALAGGTVIAGPHVANFEETYTALQAQDGAVVAADADAISREVTALLQNPELLARRSKAAAAVVQAQSGALDSIADRLIKALGLRDP